MVSTGSQSPQTGQVYFNKEHYVVCYSDNGFFVTIPSNGSSLFQCCHPDTLAQKIICRSQSPQTGQVYFNPPAIIVAVEADDPSHNPLKRVKFISIQKNK